MQKNQTIIGVCTALGSNGEGLVKTDSSLLIVPGLLKGEKAEIKVLQTKGNLAYGKIVELLTPAEERVRPACPVFSKCGGCQLQHLRYREQLRFKSQIVADALKKIGGVEYEVPLCVKSEKDYGYRNKLQLPIGNEKGENLVGFYAERSHRIVKTDVCPIHPDWVKPLIEAIYRFMQTCGLDGYDCERKTGELRHIVVRELRDRYLITLVSTVREIKGIDFLLSLLDGIFPEYSFYLNVNSKPDNVIFGEEFLLLKGAGFYECTAGGVVYEAGPNTFVQVNDGVRSKLYEKAVSLVGKEETVIDCYAGGGLMTAMFAKKCQRAYGIEIVPEASACAEKLLIRNKLQDKMQNICGSVEEKLSSVLKVAPQATVVLDPPRAGVDRTVLKELMRQKIEKIVMISCNPATLARDLGILTGSLVETEKGELLKSNSPDGQYQVTYLQPFDMFPQTKHVETLVVLSKKSHDKL